MKKGVLLISLIGIMLTSFVSAASYFSLSEVLDAIGPSTMVLGALFIIFLAILHNVIFINFFRGKTGISAVVSFCISLLAVYGLNRARWDIDGFFYGLGISEGLFAILIPLILLIGSIILIIKLKFSGFLMIFGALLFFAGLLGLAYEKVTVAVAGTILFLIGLWLWKRRRNRMITGDYRSSPGAIRRAGRGAMNKYRQGREYMDPRSKLARKKGRRYQRESKRAAKQEVDRMVREDWRSAGRKIGKPIGMAAGYGSRATRATRKQMKKMRRKQKSDYEEKMRKEEKRKALPPANLKTIIKEYNKLQRKNPNDPRLMELATLIKEIKRNR